jgi:hypothetical protein
MGLIQVRMSGVVLSKAKQPTNLSPISLLIVTYLYYVGHSASSESRFARKIRIS